MEPPSSLLQKTDVGVKEKDRPSPEHRTEVWAGVRVAFLEEDKGGGSCLEAVKTCGMSRGTVGQQDSVSRCHPRAEAGAGSSAGSPAWLRRKLLGYPWRP